MRPLHLAAVAICILLANPSNATAGNPIEYAEQSPKRLVCPGTAEFGVYFSCSIGVGGEVDIFPFDANEGDKIFARMADNSGFQQIAPRVDIFAQGGVAPVCTASSSGIAQINGCEISSDGTYEVRASDGPPFVDTGGYGLYVQRLNQPQNAVEMSLGQSISSTIAGTGDVDSYTFFAQTGDVLWVSMYDTPGSAPLNPAIQLYDPNGELVSSVASSSAAIIDGAVAAMGGKYLVLAMDNGTLNSGTYNLSVHQLNGGTTAIPAAMGQTLVTSFSLEGEVDAFSFAGQANDVVIVRVVDLAGFAELTPNLRLYSPQGVQLGSVTSNNTAEIVSLVLSEEGKYTALVRETGIPDNGSYSFFWQQLNGPSNVIPHTPGVPVAETISPGGEVDTYRFVGEVGQNVFIEMIDMSGFLQLTPLVRVFSPDGVLVAQATDADIASLNLTLGAPGSYSVLATDNLPFPDDTGAYTMQIDADITTGVPETPVARLSAELLPNSPNPFNPRTALRFRTTVAGLATVEIYDSMGRSVRDWTVNATTAGNYEVEWNGRDRQGRVVASGVYRSRLVFRGEDHGTQSLVLVR